eukprot:TRINITY_DN2661_c0_g1_i7.p1 TRINITY_DN2661_c0_g1~~TRINITY_DN2661_c0_g1_i7.p1  ORF type:complete len:315 (-),score=73.45 TRINITY_DN2661_c0_g1_i7:298-1242(-)
MQKLVDQLKKNINMQLDNIEQECNFELDRKYKELEADQARLRLSKDLISDAILNFSSMNPAEIDNVMKFSKQITSLPENEIKFQAMTTTERLPKDLLSQLESLNHQLLFGLIPGASTSGIALPEPETITVDQLQNFHFDQVSQQYFGINKDNSGIIAVNKQRKIVRKLPAYRFIETDRHYLQGISLSRTGMLAVADSISNTVTVYDTKTMSAGLVLRDFGQGRDYLFNAPCDVAFDSHGRMIVVDSGSRRLIVFDEFFKFSRRIDIANLGTAQIEGVPRMVEIAAENKFFVYCTGSDSILEFDHDFNLTREEFL